MSNLDQLFGQSNLAEGLDEELLTKIGQAVVTDFETDLDSRVHWENQHDQWMKLAIQVMEERTWPWINAANVKYPLLATSAMQFQARAYPTLVAGPNIVKARVIGYDPDGQKAKRAERIAQHMSYQVLEEQQNWDEDMDKLCFVLPIVGTCFKKIYYDPDKGYNCSELVLAKDLVVNYWAKSLEDATTKTHVMYMTRNKVKEHQLTGMYLEDFNIDQAHTRELWAHMKEKENSGLLNRQEDMSTPLTILEQHRWWDLDEDGYKEPYIITVEYSTKKVLRIVPRFEKDKVKSANGKILKIEPEEFFIKYSFIPNPDGGFYDLGFGALLGPLNETVNTLINQLIDSGTLYNLQAGFIAKGVRMKTGDAAFQPGEWKTVQTASDDLRKSILPLQVHEPSSTLFQLLGAIVESGQQLASVAEIFVGKMPGQNTPATTTMATIEQGMKVFTAIYKRIYRSLTKEFRRLYRLNSVFLNPIEEFQILDSPELQQIGRSDYIAGDTDVLPAADPTTVSEMLRLTKAQALLELMPLGTLNPQEVTKRILEAQDQPEIEKLMNQGPPPPDPKMMEAQMKMQAEQQKAALKMEEAKMKMALDQEMGKFDIQMKMMDMQIKEMEMQLDAKRAEQKMMIDTAAAQQKMQLQQRQGQMDMIQQDQQMQLASKQHEQAMQQGDASHQQKMKQTQESNQMKQDKGGQKGAK